jgi:cytochrome c biogenesis protein CcmG, thiol:disulfide interchange protein DsbE
MKRFLIPLILVGVLVAFLGIGLTLNPHEVPSPLIGKPAPTFTLPQLHSGEPWTPERMKGKVWLLNVWASWCPSCLHEHPVLVNFARTQNVPVVGLNYKDQAADAKAWLERNGNPYVVSVADLEGRVAIDFGVYGAPETYLIDGDGVIRFKQIGPVTPEVLTEKIMPLVKTLSAKADAASVVSNGVPK